MKTSPRKKATNRYVKDDNPELRKVAAALWNFVKDIVPGAKETVNSWGVPTFENDAPFCMYMIGKKHVTFGFHFGTSLADPESLLEGTGKNLRHVKLRSPADLQRRGLRDLVLAASRLQGKAPMPGMGGKRMAGSAPR